METMMDENTYNSKTAAMTPSVMEDGKQSTVSRLFVCTTASILRGLVTLSLLPLLPRDNNRSRKRGSFKEFEQMTHTVVFLVMVVSERGRRLLSQISHCTLRLEK